MAESMMNLINECIRLNEDALSEIVEEGALNDLLLQREYLEQILSTLKGDE